MSKVLLIEHDDTGKHYQEFLSNYLNEHNFLLCTNLTDAKKIVNDSFSVVIFDQRLENGELGTDFMVWCKNTYPHIVGIMLSAQVTKEGLEKAYGEQLIFKYLKKKKDDLIKLPEVVVAAIDESEARKISNNNAEGFKPMLIGKIRTIKNLFAPIKIYKLSDYIIEYDHIDESNWYDTFIIHAGEKKSEKYIYEKTDKIITTCETNQVFGIDTKKLGKIIEENFKLDIDVSKKNTLETNEKVLAELSDSYEMPLPAKDPNEVYLSTVVLQSNQIFEIHKIGLKLSCPSCQGEKYINVEAHIPTNHEKKRKKLIYSDNTQKIINIS